jgi:hypothetical protein
MEQSSWTYHSGGVDYISLTASDPQAVAEMRLWWTRYTIQAQSEGNDVARSSRLGYDGHSTRAGFFGSRHDGSMLRVSGKLAAEVVERVTHAGVNATRIDVQFTARHDPGLPLWGAWVAVDSHSLRGTKPGCNWAAIRHLNTFGRGDTVTVGSRQSEKYGRIYDKEMESLDPAYAGCWRYEVEYKGAHADAALARLRSFCDIQEEAARMAYSQYQAWCVSVPRLQIVGGSAPAAVKVETDKGRKLAWLRKQVAPTMIKLLELGAEQELDEFIKSVYDGYRGV